MTTTFTIDEDNYIGSKADLVAHFPLIFDIEGSDALETAMERRSQDDSYRDAWRNLMCDIRAEFASEDFALFEESQHMWIGFKDADDAELFVEQFGPALPEPLIP